MSAAVKRGRKPALVPSYRLHKASGQAVVTVAGKDFYLGAFGSDDSRRRYGEIVAARAAGRPLDPFARQPAERPADPGPSMAELSIAFLDYAEQYYVKNGRQTDEVDCYRSLMRVLLEPFALLAVEEFGPNELRALRHQMIEKGWARGYINRQVNRLRHMVKWGVGRDFAHPDVLARLQAVEPLLRGRSDAVETRPRQAVPPERIAAVRQVIRSQTTKDLMQLQLLTATRPGELLGLTTGQIDRSGAVWTARLSSHKTEHFGKTRVLAFGTRAQTILRPYLQPDQPDQRLFAIRRDTYASIIRRACDRAGVPRFVPNELRNTAGTQIMESHGFEAARAMLGQSHPSMTLHYTSEMTAKAVISDV